MTAPPHAPLLLESGLSKQFTNTPGSTALLSAEEYFRSINNCKGIDIILRSESNLIVESRSKHSPALATLPFEPRPWGFSFRNHGAYKVPRAYAPGACDRHWATLRAPRMPMPDNSHFGACSSLQAHEPLQGSKPFRVPHARQISGPLEEDFPHYTLEQRIVALLTPHVL